MNKQNENIKSLLIFIGSQCRLLPDPGFPRGDANPWWGMQSIFWSISPKTEWKEEILPGRGGPVDPPLQTVVCRISFIVQTDPSAVLQNELKVRKSKKKVPTTESSQTSCFPGRVNASFLLFHETKALQDIPVITIEEEIYAFLCRVRPWNSQSFQRSSCFFCLSVSGLSVCVSVCFRRQIITLSPRLLNK